jgi:hypothetical protein
LLWQEFIRKIPNTPPHTDAERKLLEDAMGFAKEAENAKRVAGTVTHDPVEKFMFQHKKGGEAVWGMSVADIDKSAESVFAYLWLLDTYAQKAKRKNVNDAFRQVWENLDGSRALQYTKSVSLPGLRDRVFEVRFSRKFILCKSNAHSNRMPNDSFFSLGRSWLINMAAQRSSSRWLQ